MYAVLAQLTADETGMARVYLAVLSTLFLGLVGWVGWYMRRQSERVDEHVVTLAEHRIEIDQVTEKVEEHRPKVHSIGNVEQRVVWLEEALEQMKHDLRQLELELARRKP